MLNSSEDVLEGLTPGFWRDRPVLVTGGASFIGSHLVDALVDLHATVTVVDDLTSGKFSNIEHHVLSQRVKFYQANLCAGNTASLVSQNIDTVFHLAAVHGGRGYLDYHQVACSQNFIVDGLVFQAALSNRVRKIVFASSGCVYPLALQKDPTQNLLLAEEMVGPPYDADGMYGWAKLMAEKTLWEMHQGGKIATVSCRYFTVYGPRCTESHAIIAMIARAMIKQDPFIVWGNGTQVRNWTYILDIVNGTLLAAEKIDDGQSINIGTSEPVLITEAIHIIQQMSEHQAPLEFQPWMPTGPLYRVASGKRAYDLLGWSPRVSFAKGLRITFDWYSRTKQHQEVEQNLDHLLLER